MNRVPPRPPLGVGWISSQEPADVAQPAVREGTEELAPQFSETSGLIPAEAVEALFEGRKDCSPAMREAIFRALDIKPGQAITRTQEHSLVDFLAMLPALAQANQDYVRFTAPVP